MRKIITLILTLSILSAAAAVPVTVSAETTLSEAVKMYAQVLEGYKSDTYSCFALAYIDEDDIPEMIVGSSGMHSSSPIVYSVKNGTLTETKIPGSYGILQFSSEKNIVQTYDMRFGLGYTLFSYLDDNGSYVEIKQFEDNAGALVDNTLNIDTYAYGIDGVEVSEEYYNSKLNEITDNYEWTAFEPGAIEKSCVNCFKVTSSNIEDMKEHPKKYIIGYDGISVYLNDEELEFEEGQEAVKIDNCVMVPMTTIFEAFELTVDYIEKTQYINVKNNSKNIYNRISMEIGSREMTILRGETVELDVPPQFVNNDKTGESYIVVPLRAVSEALNSEVKWDGNTKTVYITNSETSRVLITVNYDKKTVQYEAFKNSGEFAKASFKEFGISNSDITYKVSDGSTLSEYEFTESLKEAFAETDYNDLSFVYYAGHSFADEDENGNFTNITSGLQTSGEPLTFSAFYDLVKDNVCGTVIIMYDGCFAGQMINEADLDPRVKIIGACKSDEESYDYYISRLDDTFQVTQIFIKLDDAGQCSLFSYVFYDGIMNNKESVDSNSDNSITFKELFNYISNKLPVLADKADSYPPDKNEDSDENVKTKKGSSGQQPYHQTAVCYPKGDSTELFIY